MVLSLNQTIRPPKRNTFGSTDPNSETVNLLDLTVFAFLKFFFANCIPIFSIDKNTATFAVNIIYNFRLLAHHRFFAGYITGKLYAYSFGGNPYKKERC